MPPEERDPASLWDMLKAAREAVEFTKDLSLERFLVDSLTRSAVERKLEIIGEAGRRISAVFRAAHPEIPWKDIIGLRNVISHDYDSVDYPRIFDIAIRQLPELIGMLEPLVPPPPETEKGEQCL